MPPVFSPSEQKILKLIGKRKIKLAALTEKFYKGVERPFNADIIVASTVRRINRKCSFLRAPWRLAGQGLGRQGRTVWLEMR